MKSKEIKLPGFLYEDDGEIKVGVHGDSCITDEYNKWVEKIFQEIQEKDKKIDSMADLLLNYDKLADRTNAEIEAKDKEIFDLKNQVEELKTQISNIRA